MIPAKIIEINDKVMVEYMKFKSEIDSIPQYTIAEVENDYSMIINYKKPLKDGEPRAMLFIGQSCFIEPTENGKVKIVKI